METFSCTSIGPSKYRHNFTNSIYHNVPRNTMRHLGSDYALPNCNGRRSTSAQSITHQSLWQERPLRLDRKPSTSKGRVCSIALAVASFLVFVVVLAIAGLALYMSVAQTEPPVNSFLTFSCSAKILRGDRFSGALQEKTQKYKRLLETLYEKSALGPAFISCSVEKFGKDELTLYFKLVLNRRKLSAAIANIEKVLKDIILNDALSKRPVFRHIRFDPRSIIIKQVSDNIAHNSSSANLLGNLKNTPKNNKVILKPQNFSSIAFTPKKVTKPEEIVVAATEKTSSVLQGSFKISKTEADITEKKTETSTYKPKTEDRTTTIFSTTNTALKESSSALYKKAVAEKSPEANITSSIEPVVTTTPSVKKPTTVTTTTPETFKSPQVFDEEPWVPIVPNLTVLTEQKPPLDNMKPSNVQTNQLTYTSFTNPGLSFHFNDAEPLGSTSLKSHPIPVNKIPLTKPYSFTTEASTSNHHVVTEELPLDGTTEVKNNGFIKNENLLRNISSIFHSLASTLNEDNMKNTKTDDERVVASKEEILGQGQVEVVEGDIQEIISQTTKIPLVTLLPVRSNSGIGRPFRRKPNDNLLVENRSFPNNPIRFNSNDAPNTTKKDKTSSTNVEDFRIMGVLNFATEGYPESRDPKMDEDKSEVMVYATNSTITTTRKNSGNNTNILTPEEMKKLSEISKVNGNGTGLKEPIISTKAISSGPTINDGFKVLTKTYHKLNSFSKHDYISSSNESVCDKFSFRCGDGKCLPETVKCNQLIDCPDGKDEANCSCVDYLKAQYLVSKICDGSVDCWDFSDENKCAWCSPGQYVCSNSKTCIDKTKICDGLKDCPQGDDERQCVTISSNETTADEVPYHSEGFLMVRKHGTWGKLCVDNFENIVNNTHTSWEVDDLGKAVCKSLTYQKMEYINSVSETNNSSFLYFELSYTQNQTKSSLAFNATYCPTRKVVKVKCQSLECGARPQALKHIARRLLLRVVGGGNAGPGAWPWQAALYKEGEFQCGATLISDKWLLSAGHCFYHSQEEHWVARLGALRRGTALPSPYEQLRFISRIVIHPGYLDFGFVNDISLLKMDSPVVFSDYVRPVCLPPRDHILEDARLCTVVGWGQLFEVGRIFPDTLQEVQVPVISTAECRKRTVFLPLYKITDDMFCAGYERGGRDACLGDSGGPLMCPESNGRWTLYGITSNGYGCARANRPGVYTKVANYVEWISSYVNNEEYNSRNFTKVGKTCAGHRCPLGECLPENRLCNGFIECSDGSDENNC